jgi:nucleoside-diphosphate-sugar epimerase
LVTGGFGFIGLNLIDILEKEGHRVIVIDRQEAPEGYDHFQSYCLNLKDEKVEEVFSNHSIECLVHLGEDEVRNDSIRSDKLFTEQYLVLSNLLAYASKYTVSKFIYLSTLEVYGKGYSELITESTKLHPETTYSENKLDLESACISFNQDGRKLHILRVGQVVGPHQEEAICDQIKHEINVSDYDYLYVKDLIYGIISVINFSISPIINIAARPIDEKGFGVDTSLAKGELYWYKKKSLEDNLNESQVWFDNQRKIEALKEKHSILYKMTHNKFFKWIVPFIENFVTFILFIFVNELLESRGIDSVVDLLLVYIIVMGVVYGLRQSSLASFLSVVYYVLTIKSPGETFLSATYNVDTLLHISVYIFVGSVIGYMFDSKRLIITERETELKEIKEKLDFVYDMYDESKTERLKLHNQILATEDSFGKIYNIILQLESVEPDALYASAISVVEDILKVNSVYIYFITKNKYFMRLISQSKGSKTDFPKSINIEKSDYLKVCMENEIFINKEMKEDQPMVVIPIGNYHQIFSMIFIRDIEFEKLTAYNINLMKVLSNLITNSIARAYKYEEAIEREKYVDETELMKWSYFVSIAKDKLDELASNNIPVSFLIIKDISNEEELINYLSYQLRDFDYFAMVEHQIVILLSNTTSEESQFVIKRFRENQLEVNQIGEDELNAILDNPHNH